MSDEEYVSDVDESDEDAAEEDKATSPRENEDDDEAELEEGEELGEEEATPEEVDEFDPNPLTEDHIRQALSMLTCIGDGLSHAYITLDIKESDLTDVNKISSLIHVRHVNMNNNFVRDLSPLSSLSHLLTLRADENLATRLSIEELPYLQVASLRKNKINTMADITHPLLTKLYLTENLIPSINFPDPDRLGNLTVLDLRGNKLEEISGRFPSNLEELYLAANLIKSVGMVEGLQKLRILHLRDNQFEHLDRFSEARLESLTYLNLRGNNIEETSEASKVKSLPMLKALVLQDNPMSESDDYRVEVLASLGATGQLLRLDKDEVDEDELEEAKGIIDEREQKRLEEEAEAAEAATAAAAEAAAAAAEATSRENTTEGNSPSFNLQTQSTAESPQS